MIPRPKTPVCAFESGLGPSGGELWASFGHFAVLPHNSGRESRGCHGSRAALNQLRGAGGHGGVAEATAPA
jgi:hypothetical protein